MLSLPPSGFPDRHTTTCFSSLKKASKVQELVTGCGAGFQKKPVLQIDNVEYVD